MYVIIGKQFQQFTLEQIIFELTNTSKFLLDETSLYNQMFGEFLETSFGFDLIGLLPTIQFVASFFNLKLNYELPTAAIINKDKVLEVS